MLDPLTQERALAIAKQQALRHHAPRFVVRDGPDFAVASDEDLDTWWLGATVTHEFDANGDLVPTD